jgi:hypothetical protein
LPLTHAGVEITDTPGGLAIEARVKTNSQTGVEMEALTAVAVAALTIYDMVKAVDKTMVIDDIHLVEKIGGRSGHYRWSSKAARPQSSKTARLASSKPDKNGSSKTTKPERSKTAKAASSESRKPERSKTSKPAGSNVEPALN